MGLSFCSLFMNLSTYIQRIGELVDQALDSYLPEEKVRPTTVHKAMRYSLFAGGKRLRPVLCLAAAEACGGSWEKALPSAAAIEMIHTYSLIHDDLPSLDNDDLRRGNPTNHKVFGEGIALLAGDALLTEAFLVLAQTEATPLYPTLEFIKEFALTGSSRQLIGGQILDLEGEKKQLNQDELIEIHKGKTAALIICSLRLGAMSANAPQKDLEALTEFGYNLGLAFQAIDDILDLTADTATLGKTAGKDIHAQKSTYPSILGLEGAKEEALRLTQAANEALLRLPESARPRLQELADYLLNRSF